MRAQRLAVLPADTPDHPLRSMKDVSQLLAISINQLRRGEIDPRIATCTGYLANVLLSAIQQSSFEERLARLEAIQAPKGS